MMEPEEDPDVALARELNSLSLKERNHVLECIHGVDDVIKETPEMVERKLVEFQEALDRFEHGGATTDHHPKGLVTKTTTLHAYILARRQSEAYVTDRKFRIMFLRAEAFDATLAAQRMLIYLEEKLSRFGPHALTRNLTLKDLSPQTREVVANLGIHQLLPVRDSAGRAIILIHQDDSPRQLMKEHPMALVNSMFYMLSVAAEDEETQKRGLITIQFVAILPKMEDLEVIRVNVKHGNASRWCPVRIKANHIWAKTCQDNPLIRMILNSWTKGLRVRMRMHTGSYTELRYHLQTYGIPSDCLPYSSGGEELMLNAHNRWLSRRKKKESAMRNHTKNSSTEFRALDLPGCRDICLGRGSASHQHAGNVYMRSLMSTLLEQYRVAPARERQELNSRLVQMVREGGGRFLNKASAGGWFEEVTDEVEIERRVGGSFRGMLSRIAAAASSDTTAAAAAAAAVVSACSSSDQTTTLTSGTTTTTITSGDHGSVVSANKRPRLDLPERAVSMAGIPLRSA